MTRAGRFIKQVEGYKAFIPAPLPPEPALLFDPEMLRLLSEADHAVGQLDGVASKLPNPEFFVAMYVRHEAVLSSQIEGTQSTLEDILEYEIGAGGAEQPKDVEEVVNYVSAMNHGLARLDTLPLSLRLIREIHEKLMTGTRGGEKNPGEFRRTQNWIGPSGATLRTARFVPPPVSDMQAALDNLENFLHDEELPILVHCALVHAQFETIHPFLDGNGRVGRLLITFLLCHRQVLSKPLLYLSAYLKTNRIEYYDRLMAIRNNGDWEGWIKFFLRGVSEVSRAATGTAHSIVTLRETQRANINKQLAAATIANSMKLLDLLFDHPIVTVRIVEENLNCAFVTASKLVDEFVKHGILKETTGGQRNRVFRFEPYLDIFNS
jgi:Fic family protein